jgi:hypothetical protein
MDSLDSFHVPHWSRVILVILVSKVLCCLNKYLFRLWEKFYH